MSVQSQTLVIPAYGNQRPGTVKSHLKGAIFYCDSATGPFRMQFNAEELFDARAGMQVPNRSGRIETLTFYNTSSYPITVSFYVAEEGVTFPGESRQQDFPTYSVGNLGIAPGVTSQPHGGTGLNVNTGTLTANASNVAAYAGCMVIPNNAVKYLAPGINQGNRRKQIKFTVPPSYAANNLNYALYVYDTTGAVYDIVQVGESKTYITSGDFLVGAGGGNCNCLVSELFYLQ